MRLKDRKALKALALFLVFCLTQVYVHTTLAGPALMKKTGFATMLPPQAITARLTTRGNQSVMVNGTNASTGASILTGATIETGDGVGATVNLGPLGSIDLAPNTKVEIQFDNDGLKLKLFVGCTVVRNKKGKKAEISTDQGVAIRDEGSTSAPGGGVPLDVCYPSGAPNPIVNQGAAANAGAGAGPNIPVAGATAAGGESGGLFGLGTVGTVLLIGGIGAAIAIPIILTRGDNPSPGRP
jgi:hypothetical protein